MTKMRKSLSILIAALLVLALLPMSAGAVEIQDRMGTVTVDSTVIGFAGQEWYVIGYNGKGVYTTSGDKHLTLLVKGGNPYGNIQFDSSGSSGN